MHLPIYLLALSASLSLALPAPKDSALARRCDSSSYSTGGTHTSSCDDTGGVITNTVDGVVTNGTKTVENPPPPPAQSNTTMGGGDTAASLTGGTTPADIAAGTYPQVPDCVSVPPAQAGTCIQAFITLTTAQNAAVGGTDEGAVAAITANKWDTLPNCFAAVFGTDAQAIVKCNQVRSDLLSSRLQQRIAQGAERGFRSSGGLGGTQ